MIALIGNLSRDLLPGQPPRVGGGPYHGARALQRLRVPARVVARCAEGDRAELLPPLARLGTPPVFDLVVADYAMPQMTGEELLRRIRAIAPALPVVIVTGYAALEALQGEDNVEVLHKPIDAAILIDTVEQALRRPTPSPRRWAREA